MPDTETPLGFIGLGLMGRPMTLNLLRAGCDLTVWNRSADKYAPIQDAGAKVAASPAALAQGAQIVMTCVSDTAAVEGVVFGAEGIAAGAAPGKLLVDLSSIGVAETREIAARLERETGMRWIDAPVSGGVPGAEEATLAIMAGGKAEDIDVVRPYLAAFSRRVTHMGDNGAGQVAKLCNQVIVACNLAVVAEALALAQRSGVEAGKLPEALQGGFADSIPFQLFAPRMVAGVLDNPLGHLATMHKDANNARALAAAVGAQLPMTDLAAGIYQDRIDHGHARDDCAALITRYQGE